MKSQLVKKSILAALLCAAGIANANTYTFNDGVLASGNSYTQSDFTLSVTTSNGGVLSHIGSGQYAGLWLGTTTASFGSYQFAFSKNITSISIQFDALSSTGGTPVETIGNFASSNGAATISYTNLNGTTFNGSTIFSETNDGRGLITYSGPSFSGFSFDHAQNPSQNGFVIEQITIQTAPVPEPETYALMMAGLGLMGVVARRRKAMQA